MSEVEEIVSETFNKELAVERLSEAIRIVPPIREDSQLLRYLASLFVSSDALATWLLSRDGELKWLVYESNFLKSRDITEFKGALEQLLLEYENPGDALRIFKHRELSRIALRELNRLADLQTTLSEWSLVADVAIDKATSLGLAKMKESYGRALYKEGDDDKDFKEAEFAVIGMGKLGGGELNISSDVDLIYIHTSDNGSSDGKKSIGLHEYFVRLGQYVSQLLNDVTNYGYCFRVDTDLRPEGSSGELSNSIGAAEIYYESWGQTWERQAYIKARHVGGSKEVTDELLDRLGPFVYRKYFDKDAIGEIAVIKDKIEAKLNSGLNAKKAKYNIKLGEGGIREIEFIVQTIQLLSGGKHPELKVLSTLTALDIILKLQLISKPHYNDLKEAYILFREVENRVQYRALAHTHQIPESNYDLELLAWQLGITGDDSAKRVQSLLDKHRVRVRAIFNLLFLEDQHKMSDDYPVPIEKDELEQITLWLESLKFDMPLDSAKRLLRLKFGDEFSYIAEKSITLFDKFGPQLVHEAAATSWPDNVLIGLELFLEKNGAGRNIFYEILATNRHELKLLAALFSSSERLTQLLISTPDAIDSFLINDSLAKDKDSSELLMEFNDLVGTAGSIDEKLAMVNLYKAIELLRLGLALILKVKDKFAVMRSITLLAESYVEMLATLAESHLSSKGIKLPKHYLIIACGKLARSEMNFGSDLDLIIFYDSDREDGVVLTKFIQLIIKYSKTITKHGRGFDIDLRLRPDGFSSPVVTPLSFAKHYYLERAKGWERLALTGLRLIRGDKEVATKLKAITDSFVYKGKFRQEEKDEIVKIRSKMVAENVKEKSINIKFGHGGLVDIEFITESLIIEHHPKLKRANKLEPLTYSTIVNSFDQNIIDKESYETLLTSYNIYRSIEDAIRLDQVTATNELPVEGSKFKRVVKRAAIEGLEPERFLDHLSVIAGKVSALFNKTFTQP
ncbi:MAG: bifunctional [glutamate--ammonia ligase]-adenylyl-L-tyrosine phosphorylase/[glutamate--ammonia-ligase] adenylyltransferase [Nitrospinota bacterium]